MAALAVEFLGAFNGLYSDVQRVEMDTPPTIYVYCFAKGEEPEEIARRLVIENFGWDVSAKILEVFRVRTFQIKVKEKVLEIDGLLKNMQGDLCTTGNGSGGGNKNDKGVVGGGEKQSKKKLKEASQRLEYDQLQKKSKEVINDLETMSM